MDLNDAMYIDTLTENNRMYFITEKVEAVRDCWVGGNVAIRSKLNLLPRPDECASSAPDHECENKGERSSPRLICPVGSGAKGCKVWPWSFSEKIGLLEIFRTDEIGLGVRATQRINKNERIATYAGEIKFLPKQRDQLNNYVMKFDEMFCIDAKKYGNVSRFINHRCKNFNARVYRAIFECKPLLYIKTCKVVAINEEITINYGNEYTFEICLCVDCKADRKRENRKPVVSVKPTRRAPVDADISDEDYASDESLFELITPARAAQMRVEAIERVLQAQRRFEAVHVLRDTIDDADGPPQLEESIAGPSRLILNSRTHSTGTENVAGTRQMTPPPVLSPPSTFISINVKENQKRMLVRTILPDEFVRKARINTVLVNEATHFEELPDWLNPNLTLVKLPRI